MLGYRVSFLCDVLNKFSYFGILFELCQGSILNARRNERKVSRWAGNGEAFARLKQFPHMSCGSHGYA